jgi:hypothetical protein
VSPSVLFRRRTGVQGLERPELVIGPDRTRAASTIIYLKAGGFRLDHCWRLVLSGGHSLSPSNVGVRKAMGSCTWSALGARGGSTACCGPILRTRRSRTCRLPPSAIPSRSAGQRGPSQPGAVRLARLTPDRVCHCFATANLSCDVLPAQGASRIRQSEHSARRRKAAQHVFAQRHKRCRSLGGDCARDQRRPAQRPA